MSTPLRNPSPTPPIDAQMEFWDRWNLDQRKGSFDETACDVRLRAVEIIEHLEAIGLQDGDILEIGCGTGWLSEKLCKFGKVTAVDLAPQSIELARSRGSDADFRAGDFLEMDFGDETFDVAVCVETLFYVYDQPRMIEKISRLLRSKGLLALTTLNKFVCERRSDLGAPDPGEVQHWLGRSELRELLSTRFRIQSWTTMNPAGDQGILRLANSYKVNAALGRMFSSDSIKRVKEKIGLGSGFLILATKNE